MTNLEEVKGIPILEVASLLGIEVDSNKKAVCINGHDTKTPSLSFNTDKNYFKCFGCDIGGSNIDLVLRALCVSTGEAIKWLADNYNLSNTARNGLKTGKPYPSIGTEKETQEGTIFALSSENTKPSGSQYTQIYRYFLELCDKEGGRAYLATRGIKLSTNIRELPKNQTMDMLASLKQVFTLDKLIESGIVSTSKKGKQYLTFWKHRLIIPYYDTDGKTILNLQGRNIDNQEEPRYKLLTGIETTLFNMETLASASRGDSLYICEGAIDTLSIQQLTGGPAIGTPGTTNFKYKYYRIILQFKLIIATDYDSAGEKFYLSAKRDLRKIGKAVHRIDFEGLKDFYKVEENTKDINDILRGARTPKTQKVYSKILEDTYTERGEGIQFESGVFYSKKELDKIKTMDKESIIQLHAIKKTIGGVLCQ